MSPGFFLSPLRRSLWYLAVALCVPITAQANPFETMLDNGMKVVVREDRRAPSVVHMLWYRSGSRRPMFAATVRRSPGDPSSSACVIPRSGVA